MAFHIILESLLNTILISGLVVVMMMMIESLNIESAGGFFAGLRRSRTGQVICAALLGSVPGCMGGFAVVSLYTHGLMTFGALVAMMIATAGDESFVLLAMAPGEAVWIMLLLFALAVAVGIIVDRVHRRPLPVRCDEAFAVHEADLCGCGHGLENGTDARDERCAGDGAESGAGAGDGCHAHKGAGGHECHHKTHETCVGNGEGSHKCNKEEHHHGRRLTWKRALMFVGTALFLAALVCGALEHEHGEEALEVAETGGINLLSEEWMNIAFGALGLLILGVLVFASDHFVEEHLWHHIVVKHLPSIFAWTFGVLVVLGLLLHYFDIESWISGNTVLMIFLAAAIGMIPESGPHLVFITLYASGIVPLPVLLASCVSQDGHAGLPLLAESKMSFAVAKLVNFAVAVIVGLVAMLV